MIEAKKPREFFIRVNQDGDMRLVNPTINISYAYYDPGALWKETITVREVLPNEPDWKAAAELALETVELYKALAAELAQALEDACDIIEDSNAKEWLNDKTLRKREKQLMNVLEKRDKYRKLVGENE